VGLAGICCHGEQIVACQSDIHLTHQWLPDRASQETVGVVGCHNGQTGLQVPARTIPR
jgi:hypothetical protein